MPALSHAPTVTNRPSGDTSTLPGPFIPCTCVQGFIGSPTPLLTTQPPGPLIGVSPPVVASRAKATTASALSLAAYNDVPSGDIAMSAMFAANRADVQLKVKSTGR